MTPVYLQRIGTATPEHDIHEKFVSFAEEMLIDSRAKAMFRRLASRSGIRHRYSCLEANRNSNGWPPDAFSMYGSDTVPSTRRRMQIFEECAPALMKRSLDELAPTEKELACVRHVLVTCCTGHYAPGLDFAILNYLNLPTRTERTMIGFMGCYAAINALRLARHIVRSNPKDAVLIVSLELCSLHFRPSQDLNDLLSFLLFADGCAAALVSAEQCGLAMDEFLTMQIDDSYDSISWRIGDLGFDMFLSSHVPRQIEDALRQNASQLMQGEKRELWAVHPGGRSILDAVEGGLGLSPEHLIASRRVLENFGNMSSATVLFVLRALMETAGQGQAGCAMSFGPGLTAEMMRFHAV